ncbi:MAG TPA: orotidine 5-phosphate decarboxylase [Thermofilaceae archaeon]|nr:orotidine 5-phosphate decarboxylase [Thermofilaceae archaeon]
MRRLQVALDLIELDRALRVASRVVEKCGTEHLMLEAGTPLIKASGMKSVRALAENFRGVPVVADMKTADAGSIEAALAFSNGASYTTVLALASDETIMAVVEKAREMGGKVIGDLMCVKDPVSRALRLDELEVDVVAYHVPVDVQKARGVSVVSVADTVERLASMLNAEVAIAGGVTPLTAETYLEAGATIIIVGRYIYGAPDPGEAAQKLVEILD